MKVLVCGGRDLKDKQLVDDGLNAFHSRFTITKLIHGGATGADRLAQLWAVENGIEEVACPADWERFKKRKGKNPAGVIRNREMYCKHEPEAVVGFPGGEGTSDMLGVALAYGHENVWATHISSRRLCRLSVAVGPDQMKLGLEKQAESGLAIET